MAVRFSTNVPVHLVFPYGDYLDVDGQFGPQHMYTVEVGGARDRLYASPTLHKELQAAEVGPGSEFTVTRTERDGNRKGWQVVTAGANGHGGPGKAPAPKAEVDENPATPVNGSEDRAEKAKGFSPPPVEPAPDPIVEPGSPRSQFVRYQVLMKDALEASYAAWSGVDPTGTFFRSEDVRAVGISLFIQCAGKGVLPELEELPF